MNGVLTMELDIVSYLMGAKASGGGGSGEIVSYYTPILNTSEVSSVEGLITRIGNRAYFSGVVRFAHNDTGTRLVFTVPNEVKPAGYYPFIIGQGGDSTQNTGYMTPDGEVYFKTTVYNWNYANFEITWDIPSSEIEIGKASFVTEVVGKICVVDSFASMSLKISANPPSANWQNGILTIPSSIKPISDVRFFVSQNTKAPAIKDTSYTPSTGEINIWLPSGGQDMLIQSAWIIGQ